MDILDIDFRADDESFGQERDGPAEPAESDVQYARMVDDALHHNFVHLQKCDIDELFYLEDPLYCEAQTLPELIDRAKERKIKALLLFMNAESCMSEIKDAIDALTPYCTAECVDKGKILFCAGDESTKDRMKYRMLYA